MKIHIQLNDDGKWVEVSSVRVSVENLDVPGEDEEGDLIFNFTHEGVITDVWRDDEDGLQNDGTKSQTYDEIVEELVENNS